MNNTSGIEKLVCDEIEKRQQLGINKYGTTVQENPLNLRQWLQHAFEESLDQAVYLRRAIHEIDIKTSFDKDVPRGTFPVPHELISAEDDKQARDMACFLWQNSSLRHGLFTPANFILLVSGGLREYILKNKKKDLDGAKTI